MRIWGLCTRKRRNPKTPEIAQAEKRAIQAEQNATLNKEIAKRDLDSARTLASSLARIRRENHFGESFARVFGGE